MSKRPLIFKLLRMSGLFLVGNNRNGNLVIRRGGDLNGRRKFNVFQLARRPGNR